MGGNLGRPHQVTLWISASLLRELDNLVNERGEDAFRRRCVASPRGCCLGLGPVSAKELKCGQTRRCGSGSEIA